MDYKRSHKAVPGRAASHERRDLSGFHAAGAGSQAINETASLREPTDQAGCGRRSAASVGLSMLFLDRVDIDNAPADGKCHSLGPISGT